MILTLLSLVVGLVLLIASAERFIYGAAALARNLRVSALVVGVVIVGFGTSAPEMLVSSLAAWQGNPGLAIGNAIGSNITNIALILGIAAIIRPLTVNSTVLHRELPILLAAVVIGWLLLSNGRIDRVDGLLLLLAFAAIIYWMLSVVRQGRAAGIDPLAAAPEQRGGVSNLRAIAWLAVGLVVLLASSRLLVWAAVDLAELFGVSDLVIGLTVVAVGTSLPELAASITAAIKREDDLAVGNVVGSNTFNTLAVLGIPGVIAPGPFDPVVLSRDVPVMVVLTLALFAMCYGFGSNGRVNRWEGSLLVAAFCGYQWLLFGGG
ncbi:MAG: calcium/sodium antiporter [Gammaproteobacteria bacterium]|nr:calcium/sodium antiporter [Gammaproteobacteria bacterium]MBK80579.1 calcium/sodium antiporter [Gammaproteobacteria bacterium]